MPLSKKKLTYEHKMKIGKANLGKKNGMWKGNNVGYFPLHEWIKKRKPKPKFCEKCKIRKSYDLANISGNYKRDVNDFEYLCRKCHMNEDGRLKKLQGFNDNKRINAEEKKKRYKIYCQKNREKIRLKYKRWYEKNKIKKLNKGKQK